MKNELALQDTMTIADAFVQSGFFQDAKSQAQAVVKIMAGSELGFGPMASMTGVYIVKGKVTLSANLMAAAVKRTGRYNYRVTSMTDDECVIDFFEGKENVGTSSFSMKDATTAGLTNNPTWKKFPRNMLFARALSNGVKWYCPDIFGAPLYTPDELGASVDGETGEIIEPEKVVVIEQEQPASNGKPMPDDELVMSEASAADFFKEAADLIPRYGDKKAIVNAAKKLGYTAVPGKSYERVEMYKSIRDYAAQRDAEDAEKADAPDADELQELAAQNPDSVHADFEPAGPSIEDATSADHAF